MNSIEEKQIDLISEGTRLEGDVFFDELSRVHGVLIGRVRAKDGSTLILAEKSMVEGTIDADTIIIAGYVRGNIRAKSKVVISKTGRVVGNIKTKNFSIEFGAYFEGRCKSQPEQARTEPN